MPSRTAPDDLPRILSALAREADRGPLERRLLVAPTVGAGRELLRSLARSRPGIAGFVVTTPRPLSQELAAGRLAAEGRALLDPFAEEARIHDCLDRALARLDPDSAFRELADGIGFRRAVREAVRALRLSRVDSARLRSVRFGNPGKQSLLIAVLEAYEEGLRADATIDVADVLELATEELDDGVPLPAPHVLLLPGLGMRGASGRFVRALQARGARVLAIDSPPGELPPEGLLWPVGEAPGTPSATPAVEDAFADLPLFGDLPSVEGGLPAPPAPLEFFRAAGVEEELREVLRRVRAAGARWDEVEIVTPDPGVYGPALQSLAGRLGIDATYAVGLPVERTRPGRVMSAWFTWVTEEYPASVVRRLLQGGEVVAPGRDPEDSVWLARTLRALRIGWGRDRYLPLVEAALERRSGEVQPRRHESDAQAMERVARERADLESLRRLVKIFTESVPAGAAGGGDRVSAARLAAGALRLLGLVRAESEVDRSALERMTRTLERIEATLTRPTTFSAALAALREHLSFRVPAPRTEGRAPWVSDGGALHLSDIEHGGRSARPWTFVVGMDQERFPGNERQDPLLLDGERSKLGADLPMSESGTREQRFRLLALVEGVRGRVTLSWPAWEAAESREREPSPVLLDLYRRVTGRPDDGYAELRMAAGEPASRVPRENPPVDVDDVWFERMGATTGPLLGATELLRARFDALDSGVRAREAVDPGAGDSPFVGVVSPDPRMDPFDSRGPVLSASSLEALGACPLRYFYRKVLDAQPPEDPEFDPERWLTGKDRGQLLHDSWESAVRRARDQGVAFDDDAFLALAEAALESRAERARQQLPPPSATVFRSEKAGLLADVRSWARLMAELDLAPDDVVGVEVSLSDGGGLDVGLPGGSSIRVRGRIDRIDRVEGGVRLVDYKTGSRRGFESGGGIFDGGRRLQHALYALAWRTRAAMEGREERVVEFGYHFPTVSGENTTFDFPGAELERGAEIVRLLSLAAAEGRFVPTDDAKDCRWCDYRDVCRADSIEDAEGNRTTPRVAWTNGQLTGLTPALTRLHAVRKEGSE